MLIMFGTIAGCWTKQSGLILLVPLVMLMLATTQGWWVPSLRVGKSSVVACLALALFIAGIDEVWRYSRTGIFLVSNQQYFDYASAQSPGAVSKISFLV